MNTRRVVGSMCWGMAFWAVAFWAVALLVLVSGPRASAQNIDTLFRQFNSAMDAQDYAESERVANKMLTASTTQGWQAASLNCLGRACHHLSRLEEAERHFLRGLTIPLASDNTNNGWIPNNLALVYKDQKRFDEADRMLRRALQHFERSKGSTSGEYATITRNLGGLAHDQGKYREAETLVQKCYDIRRALYGDSHAEVASALSVLGDMSRHLEEFDKSEQRYRSALAMEEKLFGANHPEVAATLHYMATMYRDAEKFTQAEEADRRALRIREEKLGPNHKSTRSSLESLAKDLENQGKRDEGAEFRTRLAALSGNQESPASGQGKLRIKSPVASVYDGQTAIAEVKADEEYAFNQVNGKSYLIRLNVGGKQRLGWVKGQDVELISTRSLAGLPATWQPVSPPRSRFTVAFPAPPKASTQTVNAVLNHAFSTEMRGATYLVSYFDIPSDKQLSFDSAISAFTTARKGTIKSRKNFEQDLYPGREFVVELSDGTFCRMRLLTVNRRWYQIVVEGGADIINDDDASKFLNSFALAD